ncbi:LOW QUALITY PROTEIN: hypothetical protein CFC21_059367, partial [Triticum aestivum]|uniref:Uncharacterized protein n=2 Tax=Triticum aestivum TaxID=4565 RepID=A0A3B6IYN6_WHEAT
SATSSLSSPSSSSSSSKSSPTLKGSIGGAPSSSARPLLSPLLCSMPSSMAPRVHALAFKLVLASSPISASCLITMYSRSRLPDASHHLFDEIPVAYRDPFCYSSSIVGLAQNGRPRESLSVFVCMRSNAVASTRYALSGALRAAAALDALEQACGIHAHALVIGLDENVSGTALLDAYGKAGVVEDARKVFEGLGDDRNLITWNVMLAAQQGDVQTVNGLFHEMMESCFEPDGLTFLALLTACSNAGAAREAEFWLEAMHSKYKVKPGLEHYTCVIAGVARVGRLEDAGIIASTVPCKPDAAVWRTLLTGCVVHRKDDMAGIMGQCLLEIDPKDDSANVMLANVDSTTVRKDEVAEAWTATRHCEVRKEVGRSWVEVRG